MRIVAVLATLVALSSGAAQGQNSPDHGALIAAFAGNWRVFETAFQSGGPCTLALTRRPRGGGHFAEQVYCDDDLQNVALWHIEDGQLLLSARDGAPVARLGGSPERISGEMEDGRGVILERTRAGDAEPMTPDCLYVGYGQRCADKTERAALGTSGGQPTDAQTTVHLRLRKQPRPDAPVVTVMEPRSCVSIEYCLLASDGPWCRTSFNGEAAWARRHAIRRGTYPVLTYVPGCSQ